MSRYAGNDEACTSCSITYGRFRTGFTYQDVWVMCGYNESPDPSDWKYKRRGTVLGKWFEIKQGMWAHHKEECRGSDDG